MSTVDSSSYQVFLSYSSKDREWADGACEILEGRGIRCWIAPRDITPGTEWGAAIIDGIDRTKVMVLIFSAHANDSSQVRREVERALSKGLAILPLRLEDVRPHGSMEYALSNTHWLDAFAASGEESLCQLADSVEALLDVQSGVHRAQPTSRSAVSRSIPDSLRKPTPWIVLCGSLGLLLLIAILLAVFRGPANGLIDETSKLQGRWMAIAEQAPRRGPLPEDVLAKRQTRWSLLGQTLNIQSHVPRDGGEASSTRGRVSLRIEGGKKLFDFDGRDNQGNHIVMVGLYDFDGDHVIICYNLAPLERPPAILRPDERGSFVVKLKRAGRAKAEN